MAYEIFNLTNVTSSTDFLSFTQSVSALTGNTLGLTILIMIAGVIFISLLRRDVSPGRAFAVTSWVIMFSALALRMMLLIKGMVFWVTLLLPGIAIMLLFFGSDD